VRGGRRKYVRRIQLISINSVENCNPFRLLAYILHHTSSLSFFAKIKGHSAMIQLQWKKGKAILGGFFDGRSFQERE